MSGPGQESVWDYPRPPIVQDVSDRIQVIIGGVAVADTMNGVRICETASAPCYYIPTEDIRMDLLHINDNFSVCEWKGLATSYDLYLNVSLAHIIFLDLLTSILSRNKCFP